MGDGGLIEAVVRVFEMIEPRVELHEGKFPVAYELTFEQFAAMMDRRIESWVRGV